ncbi:MAG: Ycf66 family protein [Cyanobacteriota bacterium]|nr:Ycf66 family protein [Cyanobacteriota bacterium]
MVNASLNWASIVGIVLAVGGALLYFMRSFKPALARDYDVFFAAVGLLCGGILFFQGWRLDPILQFGQFLLAGTTVFFAYESVRLRGVTTEQARRSSFFDDEEPERPPRSRMGGNTWGDERERFEEPQPIRRRIRSRPDEDDVDDFYRPRPQVSRAAIPERAASRRRGSDDWDRSAMPERDAESRYGRDSRSDLGRYATASRSATPEFGSRRRERDASSEPRRGSRPSPGVDSMPRSSRRGSAPGPEVASAGVPRPGIPQGSPIRSSRPATGISDADFSPVESAAPPPGSPADPPTRDNSSRFDD